MRKPVLSENLHQAYSPSIFFFIKFYSPSELMMKLESNLITKIDESENFFLNLIRNVNYPNVKYLHVSLAPIRILYHSSGANLYVEIKVSDLLVNLTFAISPVEWKRTNTLILITISTIFTMRT